ncbi:MAG: carboxypeptidase regulatory-like domain-containing protein [Blastocatellia bacterium]|nr:carboxypeptidase regulatory-like domain-containing protein [Blastocatellia bacterium]
MRVPQNSIIKTFTALVVCFTIFANISIAQVRGDGSKEAPIIRTTEAPTPVPISGNPRCSDYGYDGEIKFDYATDSTPRGGVFPFTAGDENGVLRTYGGSVPENPNLFLTINSTGSVMSSWSIGPLNQIDRLITAVLVKGGANANGYFYPNGSIGDNGPFTTPGGAFGISHLSFCFDASGGPSSAPATIAGRVLNTNGRGLIGTTMILTNAITGEIYSTTTNSLGYYMFEGIPSAEFYILSASQRGVTFFESQKTFTLEEDLAGLDFVAASTSSKK